MSSSFSKEVLLEPIFSGSSLPPPPPPPPPPLLPLSLTSRMSSSTNFLMMLAASKSKRSLLTVDEMVEDTCRKFMPAFGLFKENTSINLLSLYNHCDPVIQIGPTCGLVALLMCLKTINKQIEIDLPTLLDKAKFYGFTRFGEMFSAKNMSDFINLQFSLKTELKYDMYRSMLEIMKHLCQGLPVLVPYDADSNYEPCLEKGARAHWAVICGFCIVNQNIPTRDRQEHQFKKIIELNKTTTLYHMSSKTRSWQKMYDYIKRHLSMDRLFIYARQGQSQHIQIWNFEKLCRSNQNLYKINSKILKDPERVAMIYPKDGKIDQSLSNQFIMIFHK